MINKIKRGDVFYANLPDVGGSVQKGERPVIIISNNIGNLCSEIVMVIPLTTSSNKKHLPTHVKIINNVKLRNSIVLCEQILTISQDALMYQIGELDQNTLKEIAKAIKIALSI